MSSAQKSIPTTTYRADDVLRLRHKFNADMVRLAEGAAIWQEQLPDEYKQAARKNRQYPVFCEAIIYYMTKIDVGRAVQLADEMNYNSLEAYSAKELGTYEDREQYADKWIRYIKERLLDYGQHYAWMSFACLCRVDYNPTAGFSTIWFGHKELKANDFRMGIFRLRNDTYDAFDPAMPTVSRTPSECRFFTQKYLLRENREVSVIREIKTPDSLEKMKQIGAGPLVEDMRQKHPDITVLVELSL